MLPHLAFQQKKNVVGQRPQELRGGLAPRQAAGQDLRERDAQEARETPRVAVVGRGRRLLAASVLLRSTSTGTVDQVYQGMGLVYLFSFSDKRFIISTLYLSNI